METILLHPCSPILPPASEHSKTNRGHEKTPLDDVLMKSS